MTSPRWARLCPSLAVALALAASLAPLAGTPAAEAAGPGEVWLRFEPLGQLGGAVSAVEVAGGRAYLAVGPRVQVLDLADPSRPRLLGQSPVLPNLVQDLALGDGRLFALVGPPPASPPPASPPESWLLALDVADAARPQVIGGLRLRGEGRRLQVAGGRAYVAGGAGQALTVVDVGETRAPRWLGEYAGRDRAGRDLAVDGNTLVLGRGDTLLDARCQDGMAHYDDLGLDVLDAADPAHLLRRSGLAWGTRLALAGDRLYAVGRDSTPGGDFELRVVDLSEPRRPRPQGRLPVAWGVTRLAVQGNLLYMAGASGFRLTVLEVSDPSAPRVLGEVTTGAESWDLAVTGTTVYVASRREGLVVVDAARPELPRVVGRYQPLGIVEGLAAVGRQLVTQDGCAVAIVDAEQVAEPKLVGHFDPPDGGSSVVATTAIAATASAVYVGLDRGDGGLLRVALAPGKPPELSRLLPEVGGVRSLDIAGDRAFLGSHPLGGDPADLRFVVADLDPTGPARVRGGTAVLTRLDVLAAGEGTVFGLGPTAAAMAGPPRLAALDISAPEAPKPLAVLGSGIIQPASADLARLGPYLFLGDGRQVGVVDASLPGALRQLASIQRPAWPKRAAGRWLYLANDAFGLLEAHDLAEPARPRLRGAIPIPAGVRGVDRQGDLLLVAAGAGGLWLLRATEGPPGAVLHLPLVAAGATLR